MDKQKHVKMEISKIFKKLSLIWLIISLTFIIPLEISQVYGGENSISNAIPGNNEVHTKEEIKSTCSIPMPSVKDSLIMSIIFMCLPGILEKMYQYREIKCERVVCYYNAVKNNLDPNFCNAVASYKTCKYVIGEIFAIPPLSYVEYLRKIISSILAAPEQYIYAFTIAMARKYVYSRCVGGDCDISADPLLLVSVVGLTVNDVIAVYVTLKEILNNGLNFFKFKTKSYCSELDKIEKEMKNIINNG